MHTDPEVLALLALGENSASPDERAHVETCPVCTQELAELAHLAGVGRVVGDATPLERPSPEVWRRIQAELGFTVQDARVVPLPDADRIEPAPPVQASADPLVEETASGRDLIDARTSTDPDLITPERRPGSSRGRRILALTLAAALALIVGIGIGLGWNRVTDPSPTVIGQAQLEPGAVDWDGSSGEATLERAADGSRILVVRVSTPREVPGERVVWMMDTTHTKLQTVGRLAGNEGRFTLDPKTNLADFPVVDVSEEPVNDPNPKHSGVSILRGTLNI
jgi:hypothetical protein